MYRICAAAALAASAALTAVPAVADDIAAKAQTCAACHGQNGVPIDPKTIPIIWGQQENYLVKQLHDYRAGERTSPVMAPVAQTVAQPETRAMAAYFAAKPWPAAGSAAPAAPPAAIVEKLPQCQACHGKNFEGGAPAPRLAGLSAEYLAATMRDFADGTRTNNGDMPKIMRALTDGERDAIGRYLSAL